MGRTHEDCPLFCVLYQLIVTAMIRSLLFLITALLFVACHTEQSYMFNADFSGHFTHSVDFSAGPDLFRDSTSSETGSILDTLDQAIILKELDQIEGISGIALDRSEDHIALSLSFSGIKALNEVLANKSINEGDIEQFCRFKKRGHKVMVYFDTSGLDANQKANREPADTSSSAFDFSDEELEQLFTYRFTFAFEQGVEAVSGIGAEILEDEKTVVVEETLQSLSADDFSGKLVIELKH